MILVDANLLLYAYNPSFDLHPPARRWLEQALSRPEPVRFTWTTILRVPPHRHQRAGVRATALD